jgi:hypothetical protein
MVQPKLGDVLEPLKDDSNTQTQNSIVIFENPCLLLLVELLIIMSVAWMSYMIML